MVICGAKYIFLPSADRRRARDVFGLPTAGTGAPAPTRSPPGCRKRVRLARRDRSRPCDVIESPVRHKAALSASGLVRQKPEINAIGVANEHLWLKIFM
jgi:hypothetical protein